MHLPLKAPPRWLLLRCWPLRPSPATVDPAKEVNAVKTDVLMPVGSLTPIIGEWSAGDLNFLDKAASIKVFDTKMLYTGADLQKIASAQTSEAMQLGRFRDAIRADAGLAGWFKEHNIDINRVVAVSDRYGNAQVFLY